MSVEQPPTQPASPVVAALLRDAPPYPFKRFDSIPIAVRTSLVQHLALDEGGVVALVGAPNVGKSALAVSLAIAIASTADHWLGLKVCTGPVLYLAAEGYGSVVMRAQAASPNRRRLRMPTRLFIAEGAPSLGGDNHRHEAACVIETVECVWAEAKTGPVRLLVIDTLASCLGGGDENSGGMITLVNAAKHIASKTKACVMLVHHPSKSDPTGLRGHSSLRAAVDTVIRVDHDEPTGLRTATVTKARDHETGYVLKFELQKVELDCTDSFGDVLTTVVVRPTNKAAAQPRPTGQRQLELIEELERRYLSGERKWSNAQLRKISRDDLGHPQTSASDAVRGLMDAGFLVGPANALELKYPPDAGGPSEPTGPDCPDTESTTYRCLRQRAAESRRAHLVATKPTNGNEI